MITLANTLEPLALGFSTGTWCVMYCAPVLLPFLAGRNGLTHKRNLGLVALFLTGRFAAYIAVGFSLGLAGLLISGFFDPVLARHLSSVAYIFCGIILLGSGFGKRICKAKPKCSSFVGKATGDGATALLSGLCVGLHICPPFWTAAARSAASGDPLSGAAYFLLFYIGTLPFFLPLAGIPFLNGKAPSIRRIARMTQILVGVYFLLFAGLIPFLFRR